MKKKLLGILGAFIAFFASTSATLVNNIQSNNANEETYVFTRLKSVPCEKDNILIVDESESYAMKPVLDANNHLEKQAVSITADDEIALSLTTANDLAWEVRKNDDDNFLFKAMITGKPYLSSVANNSDELALAETNEKAEFSVTLSNDLLYPENLNVTGNTHLSFDSTSLNFHLSTTEHGFRFYVINTNATFTNKAVGGFVTKENGTKKQIVAFSTTISMVNYNTIYYYGVAVYSGPECTQEQLLTYSATADYASLRTNEGRCYFVYEVPDEYEDTPLYAKMAVVTNDASQHFSDVMSATGNWNQEYTIPE